MVDDEHAHRMVREEIPEYTDSLRSTHQAREQRRSPDDPERDRDYDGL